MKPSKNEQVESRIGIFTDAKSCRDSFSVPFQWTEISLCLIHGASRLCRRAMLSWLYFLIQLRFGVDCQRHYIDDAGAVNWLRMAGCRTCPVKCGSRYSISRYFLLILWWARVLCAMHRLRQNTFATHHWYSRCCHQNRLRWRCF